MRRRALPSVWTAMSHIGSAVIRWSVSGASLGHAITDGRYGLKVSRNIRHSSDLCVSEPRRNGPVLPLAQWRAALSAASIVAEVGGAAGNSGGVKPGTSVSVTQ